MSETLVKCDHPKAMVLHKHRGIYMCMNCGHESNLKDRPYFCNLCPDAHSLTHEEFIKHKKDAHAQDWSTKTKKAKE